MEQYISKDALVREIEKQRNAYISEPSKYRVLSRILSLIDSLEVKEVEEVDINKVCRFLDGYSFIPTYVIKELRNEFSKGE